MQASRLRYPQYVLLSGPISNLEARRTGLRYATRTRAVAAKSLR